jgi:transposase
MASRSLASSAQGSLGFVESLNDKTRVSQRRPYGTRDDEYLRLKS